MRCEARGSNAVELFAAVQERLTKMKLGPRSHKKRTNLQLWEL